MFPIISDRRLTFLRHLRRLNAQKAMRREGTNIVELGTQILDRISGNTPVTSRTGSRSNGRMEDVSGPSPPVVLPSSTDHPSHCAE